MKPELEAMTKLELNLQKLRERAEQATPGPWGSFLGRVEDLDERRIARCDNDFAPLMDERLAVAYEANAAFIAAANPTVVLALLERIANLETRRDALLATVARIANETPFPDEFNGWEAQRAALIAEVGTLKGRVKELEQAMREEIEHTREVLAGRSRL